MSLRTILPLLALAAALYAPHAAMARVRVLTPYGYVNPNAARRSGGGYYGSQAVGARNNRSHGARNQQNTNRVDNSLNSPANKGKRAPAGTELDLTTEVKALKERHSNLVVNLPADLRRMDRDLAPVLDQLPLLALCAYYRTVEDYPTLPPAEKTSFGDTMRALSSVAPADRKRLTDAATKELGPIQANAGQRKQAMSKPHETFFKLKQTVEALTALTPTPAPK